LPKKYTAVNIPNKDVLILVLKKENDTLKKISELQEDQLKGYKIQVEAYKKMTETDQKMEETMTRLAKAYEDRINTLEQQLKVAADYNMELSQKIEEMQAIIDGKATDS
jgi:septal ring factor EnvC (AmiA/AmiB activator)